MIHNIDKYSVENLKKNYLILKNFSKTIPKLKIGISIYDIKDLNLIKKSNLRFDYIQIPINILNIAIPLSLDPELDTPFKLTIFKIRTVSKNVHILLLLQARQVNSFLFRLALAIKPHLSHTCTRYLNHKRAQKKSSHTSKLLGARESFFRGIQIS